MVLPSIFTHFPHEQERLGSPLYSVAPLGRKALSKAFRLKHSVEFERVPAELSRLFRVARRRSMLTKQATRWQSMQRMLDDVKAGGAPVTEPEVTEHRKRGHSHRCTCLDCVTRMTTKPAKSKVYLAKGCT